MQVPSDRTSLLEPAPTQTMIKSVTEKKLTPISKKVKKAGAKGSQSKSRLKFIINGVTR